MEGEDMCSPGHGGGRMAALSGLCILLVAGGSASAQTIREDFYVTNGRVRAQTLVGNTLYIGGDFTEVAQVTGPGVPLDATTGLRTPGFPRVSGPAPVVVNSAASDGAGGWYIAGLFTTVGGAPRKNLAHIQSDNTLSAWDPNANNTVNALVVVGGTVYVGGQFTMVGGATRNRIAAIDATTGLAAAWNPNVGSLVVSALAVSGGTVYAGGLFTTVNGGTARNNLAAF